MGYNIRGIAKAYKGSFDDAMKDIDKSLSINSEYGYGRFNNSFSIKNYNQTNYGDSNYSIENDNGFGICSHYMKCNNSIYNSMSQLNGGSIIYSFFSLLSSTNAELSLDFN